MSAPASSSRARTLVAHLVAAAFPIFVALAAACGQPADSRFIEQAPDRATFVPVADLLERRCGTLDCHGVAQRNLRLYGSEGLRLATDAAPSSMLSTTTAEYDESYQSVIGLEPEAMSLVVSQKGQNPLRLSLLRKPLGVENHKGGTVFTQDSDAYKCIALWLAGTADKATCDNARTAPP
jgi:hypothetical protein